MIVSKKKIKLKDIEVGKEYQAYSPKGHKIIGKLDRVDVCAFIHSISLSSMSKKIVLEPEYNGESEVFWENQNTELKNDKKIYLCSKYFSWPENELLFEEI